MLTSGNQSGRPLVALCLGLLLAVVWAGGAEAVPCPLGTDAGTECQISTSVTATGTLVFEKTLHILGTGSVHTQDATGFTLSIINQGDFIMDDGAELDGDQPGCSQAAPITVQLNGGNVNLKPGSEVHSNSCQGGFIQIKTTSPGTVDIDGLVESVGTQTGAAGGKPGGGPITIVAGCELTISDEGVVSS